MFDTKSKIIFIAIFSLTCVCFAKDYSSHTTPVIKDSAKTTDCLKLGELGKFKGEPGHERPVKECCSPLKFIETKEDAKKGPFGGMPDFLCAACGDGQCDQKLESHDNCPEDCQ